MNISHLKVGDKIKFNNKVAQIVRITPIMAIVGLVKEGGRVSGANFRVFRKTGKTVGDTRGVYWEPVE